MFTENCYIEFYNKLNIQELINKLELFGYSDGEVGAIKPAVVERYLLCKDGKYFLMGFEPDKYIKCNNKRCFYAIAALRNDTDKYQWFTDGKLWEMNEEDLPSKYMQLNGDKATVEEIINYFN